MRLLVGIRLSVPVVVLAGIPIPLRPLFPSLVLLGIGLQEHVEPCFNFCFFARRPSYLHDPSCKYLCNWVKVAPTLGDGGEELVCIMVVVPALENVDDGSSQTPDFCWGKH